jgi:4-hydroxy-4-methyl-2-oxoglutarate aldolase
MGYWWIPTNVYSAEEDAALLKIYDGLRVADVSDGIDMVGLPNTGLVDQAIHADWLDLDSLSHAFRGIDVTARYVPTQRPDRPKPGEDFAKWEGYFYTSVLNLA